MVEQTQADGPLDRGTDGAPAEAVRQSKLPEPAPGDPQAETVVASDATDLGEPTVRFKPIERGKGITDAERYLQGLCERSFLKLWSYPGVYRDQGIGQRKEGKEVSDLLVVFGDDVIIFSDKDCVFPNSGDLQQDWSRWFRKAVMKSAEQIWGAERWILDHPNRLYLDRACKATFPIALPPRERARVHRVVVAHAVSERCRAYHGGTGTLMLVPRLHGDDHFAYPKRPVMPFAAGDLDPTRGYVHVLDDQSLDTLLRTLDTISDFVTYLARKEELIRSGKLGAAAGEDELLAVYLTHFDGSAHHFPIPPDATHVVFDEGFWASFETNPQRRAQVEADKVSYAWDMLIEEFGKHIWAARRSFGVTTTCVRWSRLFATWLPSPACVGACSRTRSWARSSASRACRLGTPCGSPRPSTRRILATSSRP